MQAASKRYHAINHIKTVLDTTQTMAPKGRAIGKVMALGNVTCSLQECQSKVRTLNLGARSPASNEGDMGSKKHASSVGTGLPVATIMKCVAFSKSSSFLRTVRALLPGQVYPKLHAGLPSD